MKRHRNLEAEENGYVLVVVLLFMVLLTVIGVAATRTTAVEVGIAGNSRRIADDFYVTEGVLTETTEKYNPWLNNNFLASDMTEAYYASPPIDFDGDGKTDGSYEVLCITDEEYAESLTDSDSETVASEKALALPKDAHIGPAPPNSFTSVDKFEIRRYGITAASPHERTVIQAGVWRAFNKFE